MKKFYTTLSAVALGVATMAAAELAPVQAGQALDWAGNGVRINQVADMTKVAKHATKIRKASRAEEAEASVADQYVCIYQSIFTNYLQQAMTCTVNVEEGSDAYALNGFLGWDVADINTEVVKNAAPIYAELIDGQLVVAGGQLLGHYSSQGTELDIVLLVFEVENEETGEGRYTTDAYAVFDWDAENGMWVSEDALIGMGFDAAGNDQGGFCGGAACTFAAPVADMTYHWDVGSDDGDIDIPVWYDIFTDEASGETTLQISYIGRLGSGYLAEIPVEAYETENGVLQVAIAEEVPATTTDNLFYYCMASENYVDGSFSIAIDVTNPDKLTVPPVDLFGFKLDDGSRDPINQWCEARKAAGNRVNYYGTYTCADIIARNPSGIQGIVADSNNNAAPVYYNLQGIRVNNPANGIYIVKQGDKTSKVLVK